MSIPKFLAICGILLLHIILFSKSAVEVEVYRQVCNTERKSQEKCFIKTAERFGCCFLEDPTTERRQWDHYEDLKYNRSNPVDASNPFSDVPVPIVYCNPDDKLGSTGDKCGQTDLNKIDPNVAQLYKEQKQGAEVICVPLMSVNHSEGEPNPTIGRCRSVEEREVLKSDYYGKKLRVRSDWRRSPISLGKPCDIELYERYNISALWDRLLLCPLDFEYLDKEFEKILEEAYFVPNRLQDLCLGSPNMEECKEVPPKIKDPHNPNALEPRCVCLNRIWNIRRSKDELFVWDFEQVQEGKRCSQRNGNPCTFNARDLIDMHDTSSFIKSGSNQHSPKQLYSICTVFGANVTQYEVLPSLDCEQDAGCESKLKPRQTCNAKDDCQCICSRNYQCSIPKRRKSIGNTVYYVGKRSGTLILIIIVILFY